MEPDTAELAGQGAALYGAGVDSGTYDYFTEAVVGTQHSSRSDSTSSEDDDALVKDVAADELSLGFFGYMYYGSKAKLETPGSTR